MDPGDKLYPAPRHTVDVDAEALRASRQQEVRRPRSGWAPPPHFLAGGASPPQSRTAAKLRQCPRCMVLYLAENHTCRARMEWVIANHAELQGLDPEEVRRSYALGTSMQCYVDPQEISDLIMFLVSDYGRHISGQIIAVDGNTETLWPRS